MTKCLGQGENTLYCDGGALLTALSPIGVVERITILVSPLIL